MTRKPAISIVLLLAAFLALQQPILGQVPPALLGQSGGAAEAVDDALGTAPEPAAPVLVGRLSPRATMRTFLEAFPRRDWDAAIACLDLSHEGLSPAALRLRGREAATTLKDVIDRLRYVDFGDIPAEPDGAAYVFHSGPAGGIVIERQPNGEWLFSAATIAAIPTLLRELGDTEIVEGVEEAASDPRPLDPLLGPGIARSSRLHTRRLAMGRPSLAHHRWRRSRSHCGAPGCRRRPAMDLP